MWETIRGYLTFTRKERLGVLFLFLIISILFVLPYFFRTPPGEPDPAASEKMKEGIRQFESLAPDSSLESVNHDRYPDQRMISGQYQTAKTEKSSPIEMFYFDPNLLNGPEWMRLGLSERLSQTILHYVEKGGRFRKAEDLKKLYGLHPADYERLFPYVRFANREELVISRSTYNAKANDHSSSFHKTDSFFYERTRQPVTDKSYSHKNYTVTDINAADSAAWSQLPGIGARLASRIIHFREKLGGFYQVEQVGETFGIPDSVFQKIKPSLRLGKVSLIQMDINTATKEMLQAHPYIRWQLAKNIMDYRMQRGSFHSVDELLQLALMDPGKFEKLKPYIFVNP